MEVEAATALVFKEALQRVFHRSERDVIPGDLGLLEQRNLQGFFPGEKVQIQERGAINDVYLADVRQIHVGEHWPKVDLCTCFFAGFTQGGVSCRFIVLHEPGGKRPEAVAWFDGTPAHQDLIFPCGDGADHNFRVLVMDRAALITDVSRKVVARRDPEAYRGTAVGAEVHGCREM